MHTQSGECTNRARREQRSRRQHLAKFQCKYTIDKISTVGKKISRQIPLPDIPAGQELGPIVVRMKTGHFGIHWEVTDIYRMDFHSGCGQQMDFETYCAGN